MDRKSSTIGRASGTRFYVRILSYFKNDWRLIVALIVLIWVALALGALQPVILATLTDKVLSGRSAGNGFADLVLSRLPATRTGQVLGLAAIWFLLQIGNDTLTLLREMINNQLRYNGTARVRQQLFDQLQHLGPDYHKNRPQGDAIYRLNIDTQGFFGVLNTFIGAANSLLTVAVIASVMFQWNHTITLMALGLTPLLIFVNVYFGRTMRLRSIASKQADSDLTTFVQRAMSVIGLVQLFGRQETESRRFRREVDETIRTGMRMNWQEQLYPLAQRIIYAMGLGFVLGYGGYLVARGEASGATGTFTVGGILAMTFYLPQLWEPLRRVTGFAADAQRDAAACARVFDVLAAAPGPADKQAARSLPLRARTLAIQDVRFAYENARPVLRGVTAEIEPGEMVAFVGSSGAGKSTLLSLLPRFYDPAAGSLSLDGHDLRDVKLADVRKHIALVPQENPVIAGTILENISFGQPNASAARIRAAAEMSGAAEFIAKLPDGYDTVLTESGQNLSGGQRQRLAIARALLTGAPILVLDEPTSGLDRRQEMWFVRTLQRLKGLHTIILVTHNLSTVTACDRIFFLHEGQIAEEGTHEELLDHGGLYAAMAAMPHLAVEGSQQQAVSRESAA